MFEHPEEWYWDKWLSERMGSQLDSIKAAVKRLYEEYAADKPLAFYTPHGPDHCQEVENIIHRLIPGDYYKALNEMERFILLSCAWLHDLGMMPSLAKQISGRDLSDDEIRKHHHTNGEKYIANYWKQCGVEAAYSTVMGKISRYHRRQEKLDECEEDVFFGGEKVRVRLLAAYLRLADALDISRSRVPAEAYAICLAYNIPNDSKLHWIKSKLVHNVRPDPFTQEIVLSIGVPYATEFGEDTDEAWVNERVTSIISIVAEDLREELSTVTHIMRREPGLPFYLDVADVRVRGSIENQILNDIRDLLTNYDILVHPSASKLMEMILFTTANIAGYSLHKHGGPTELRIERAQDYRERIKDFLTTVKVKIVAYRPSHLGLKTLVDDLLEIVESETTPSAIVQRIDERYQKHRNAIKNIRSNAGVFFRKYSLENAKVSESTEYNILLYGFSALVTKALCGFRDYLIELEGARPHMVRNSHLEREISQRFRIFVCEGQPKTQTSAGDRLSYHDGSQYALHLIKHGFGNVVVVPDITMLNIIQQVHIDLALLGADGITPNHFIHTAGHGVVVNLIRGLERGKDSKNSKTKGFRFMKPGIVLVTSREKWTNNDIPEPTTIPLNNSFKEIDGCLFWEGPFEEQNSREHVWLARDHEILKTLRDAGVMFFNPREDRIPIKHIDYLITDTITDTGFYGANQLDSAGVQNIFVEGAGKKVKPQRGPKRSLSTVESSRNINDT